MLLTNSAVLCILIYELGPSFFFLPGAKKIAVAFEKLLDEFYSNKKKSATGFKKAAII